MTIDYRNFYFGTLKTVLDKALTTYVDDTGRTQSDVDKEIVKHMQNTTKEHYQPDPSIDYNNPLCRLGYLYTHAGANANLFERAIRGSLSLTKLIQSKSQQILTICAIGGGPGTELLGLTKFLLTSKTQTTPTEIRFRVLDRVNEWGETWEQIATVCRDSFAQIGSRVIIVPFFNGFNVMEPASYANSAWLYREVDLFVFNYLLSENQVRLDGFSSSLSAIVDKAPPCSYFVIIDRIEYDALTSTFSMNKVKALVEKNNLITVDDFTLGDVMTDDKLAWREYLTRFQRRPRFDFQTDGGKPTVRVLVFRKPSK